MAETPMGMLNAVGLQNKGVDYFVEHIYPQIRDIHTNMIVNVSGSAVEDYVKTAEIINDLDNIPAIELNIKAGRYGLRGFRMRVFRGWKSCT